MATKLLLYYWSDVLLIAAIFAVLPAFVFTQTKTADNRQNIGPIRPVKEDNLSITVDDKLSESLKSDKAVNGAGQTCGQSKYSDAGSMNLPSPRIVGGQGARTDEFPWQVKLIVSKLNGTFFCGGSVLNDRWVLTAAHCVSDDNGAMIATSVLAAFGDNRIQYGRQILYSSGSDIHVHPNYNARYVQNDICLLRMNGTILLDQRVAPVCLPSDATNLYAWRKAVASGWGRLSFASTTQPSTLQYTTLNITSNSYCVLYWSIVISSEVCTVDNTGNYDRATCQGDSGGPLVVKESDGTFYLVGVTSFGGECADGYPSVFTRVSSYLSWIYGWIGFPASDSTTTSTSTTTPTTTRTSTSTTTTTTTTPTTTTVPVLACSNMELVFIVDASSKSSSTGWQSMLSFVNSVIDRFTISQSSVRVAFVRYATDADVQFYLNWYSDKNYIKQAVSSISLIGGTTSNLDRALDLARTSVFNSARQSTWQIAIFVTDRLPYSQQVLTAASNAKSAGIQIFGVAIYGPGLIDFSTFYQLPTDSVYAAVSSYDTLNSGGYYGSYFAQSACKSSAPTTTTTTSTSTRSTPTSTTSTTSRTTTSTTPTTTTTFPVLACSNMELVFIVDASSKSSSTGWQSMLSFVNSVIDRFTISQSSVRVAFVRYATDADVQFYLNWYSDKNYIKQLVSSISLIGGTTSNLDRALDLARTSVFNIARQSTWQIAIFVTDRLPYSQQVLTAASNAKSAGIQIFGVAIYGPGLIDFSTFYQLPTDSVYYAVSSYETLTSSTVYASYFAQSACKNSAPTTSTSSTSTTTTTTTTPRTTTTTRTSTTTPTTTSTTTTTAGPNQACSNMELVFIVDASSKSSSTGWQSMLSFVNSVIDRFTISQSSVRVAFVRYATDADVQFYLNWYSDKDYIKQLVSSIYLIGGSISNLDRALDLARTSAFSGSRQGAWKVAILVTEHLNTASNQQVVTSVTNAKAAGIQLIPVGINVDGLTSLCSFYDMSSDQQFYVASDYSKLSSVSQRIANFACMSGSPAVSFSAPPTTSTSTTTTTTTAARITSMFRTFIQTQFPSGSYCSVTNIELVFVVDSSSKSDSSAWSSMLTFVNSVINKFNVAQNAVRVAFVRYGNQPTVVFNLNTYSDRNSIQSAVSNVQYTGGSSEISSALDAARTQVLSSSNVRSNALKILITVTDQLYATSVNGLATAINNCRSAGIRMYGAGIAYVSGHSLDSDTLYQLSYNSDQSNPWQATWVYGYSDLPNRVSQLAQYACVGGTLP